jgi:hypothetical protein
LAYLVDQGAKEERYLASYREKRNELKSEWDDRAQKETELDLSSQIHEIKKKAGA